MTDEQKSKLNAAANKAAAAAADKARAATGWKKWLYFAAAVIAGAVAVFTMTGCAGVYSQDAKATRIGIIVFPFEK